ALARRAAAPGGGTVGCVARDGTGRLAAATSTGGVLLKRRGRVGDSAVIGAGTYADDGAGAVSCTGLGEAFIKAAAAKQVVEALRAGQPGQAAARAALDQVRRYGGDGGLIWVDREGRLGAAFDTPHMSHAWVDTTGQVRRNYNRSQVELS
ncbi:MAG TPA: isoaspartyl peptidase/L-asparaginase, partial [Polyangia bacterium]|nr:isoaspartyl peptidase/L-asparaginase [Polyangia bacterium]